MISLAFDLAEKQLADGTASATVITHYLKLATAKEVLERQKLELEGKLLHARAESMTAAQASEEIYSKAIEAMRQYSGVEMPEEDYHED